MSRFGSIAAVVRLRLTGEWTNEKTGDRVGRSSPSRTRCIR
jgi:hypothetical protein